MSTLKEIENIEKEYDDNLKKIKSLTRKNSILYSKKSKLIIEFYKDKIKVGDAFTFEPNYGYHPNYMWYRFKDVFKIVKKTDKFVYFDSGDLYGIPKLGYNNFIDYIYHFTVEGKKFVDRNIKLDYLLNDG